MKYYLIPSETLTEIADRIRFVYGTTDKYTIQEMVDKFASTKSLLQMQACEFYDATYTDNDFSEITSIRNRGLYLHPYSGAPNFAELKTVGDYGCSSAKFTGAQLPKCESIGNYGFYLSKLTGSIELPKIKNLGSRVFGSCTGLTALTMRHEEGSLPTISTTAFTSSFLTTINVTWSEGDVPGAPWGATNATINYNYEG